MTSVAFQEALDLGGLRCLEFAVEGERPLPVDVGLAGLALPLVEPAEARVGSGPLEGGAPVGGDCQGFRVAAAGLGGCACGGMRFCGAVQGCGLEVRVVRLAGDGQGLAVLLLCFFVGAELLVVAVALRAVGEALRLFEQRAEPVYEDLEPLRSAGPGPFTP